jgi:hypothetical protein
MKIIANNRRMYIGAWLAAAFFLIGANLFQISRLEFQPLAENPVIINQLRLRLSHFDELIGAQRMAAESHREPPIALIRLQPTTDRSPPVLPAGADEKNPPPGSPLLPRLTGILWVASAAGAGDYRAVLDGRVYAEKEFIAELCIEQISSQGVVLRRHGQRWFIPAPEVYYSISQKP